MPYVPDDNPYTPRPRPLPQQLAPGLIATINPYSDRPRIQDLAGRSPLSDPLTPAIAAVPRVVSQNTGTMDTYGSGDVQAQADPQSAQNSRAFASGGIAGLARSVFNPTTVQPIGPPPAAPPIIASLPGTRTATRGSPIENAALPVSPGAMDQFGTSSPNAPSGVAPVRDPVTLAENTLSRTLAPSTGTGDLTSRGNGGIAALANNPTAQGQFNDLQAARGNGITASTDSRGQLTLTGNGDNATKPQAFTQGFDLAGANARTQKIIDANKASDVQDRISDLTARLANAQTPAARAELTSTIASLAGLGQTAAATAAKTGLDNAQAGLATSQAGLANAQAATANQALKFSSAQSQQLRNLQQQFVAEPDPAKSRVMQDKILTLLGKDPKDGAFQIVTQDEPLDPLQPAAGTRKVAAIVDQRTGVAQSLNDALAHGLGNKAPGTGVTPTRNHIDALKSEPKLAPLFDAFYGSGAARKAMSNG